MELLGVCRILIFLTCIIGLYLVKISTGQEVAEQSNQTLRLPTALVPDVYSLTLFVDLETQFIFWGTVEIQLLCLEATDVIIVNSYELEITIDGIIVEENLAQNTRSILVTSVDLDETNQTLIITLGEQLQTFGLYFVSIPFQGYLDTKLVGFYRSSYFDTQSQTTEWLAVTQADSNHARQIFPCMDQPDMKARFEILVAHPEDMIALSNMPFVDSVVVEDMTGWVMDSFEITQIMSSYLVTVVVFSDFVSIESVLPSSQIPVSVWSRPDSSDQLDLAAGFAVDALSFYEIYFSYPFPLTKMDLVMIPDFLTFGTEGFGLDTLRESQTLFHPEHSTALDEVNTALIVSHEMAHPWIGNLVTMTWWDNNVWVKEGFCNYIARVFVDNMYPDWRIMEHEFVFAFIESLLFDGSAVSHPLSFDIQSPTQIDLLYDTNSFRKSSFLFRMLSIILGEDIFTQAMAQFVTNYQYSSVDVDLLWDTFDEVAISANVLGLPEGGTVKAIMNTWALQSNYPLLTVTRDDQLGIVTISQERYVSNPDGGNVDSNNIGVWWVPVFYSVNSGMISETNWLTPDEPLTLEVGLTEGDWILLNGNLAALCLVNYDEITWSTLQLTLLDEQTFADVDLLSRVHLVMDMHGLTWTGKMNYEFMFQTLLFARYENEYSVWRSLWTVLGSLRQLISRTDARNGFQAFVRSLAEPMFLQLGDMNEFPEDDVFYARFKMYFTAWMCAFATGTCQQRAVALFQEWFLSDDPDTNIPIQRNIRGTVCCQGIALGGQAEWDFLWERYQNTNVATERTILLRGLGCSQDVNILRNYLDMSIDPTMIRAQDSTAIFSGMATSDVSIEVVRSFFFERFQDIYNFHRGNQVSIGVYISTLYLRVTTNEEFNQMESFMESVADQLQSADLRWNEARQIAMDNVSWQTLYFESFSLAVQAVANL